MERVCDFCKALRPVVYCKADAAYLCLSCDAKVHSANALSGRHPRALVCEFCGSGLVNIRCPNHCLLLCRSCDHSMHKDLSSSQHQKQVISCCYLGCPPAKDLAKLWGFNLDEFGLDSLQAQFISTSCLSGNDGQSRAFGEASSDHNKVKRNIIIQQILDLEKLQLSDRCQNSSVIRGKDLSICNYDVSWELENSNNIGKPSHEASFDLDQQLDSSQQELNPDPFLLAYFPQLDQLTSNSGNPLQDSSSFWQCKSPTQKFQLWSQNMQDLGICEEVGCMDDLKMPDVDLTFRNFEELFGGGGHDLKEESLVDNKDMKSSIPTAYDNETMGHSRVIRPTSHSTMSFSLSRFCSTAKSNATDCSASSLSSPAIAVQGMHVAETNDIDVLMKKNKQKKKDCRYNNDALEPGAAVMRKRVKGRLVKGEEFNCEGVEVTQSY